MADLVCGVATGSDVLDAINKNTADTATNTTGIAANATSIATNETAITAITDGTQALDKVTLTDVTATPPAWVSGQMFFADGGFNIHGEFDGVTQQIGEEQYIKVTNISGATIANGKPVRFAGLSASSPTIELAIASSFQTSAIMGVTTMDIPDGETGLVTTFGLVSDIDTDGLTPGGHVYLSDTVPGGFTNDRPSIVTCIGSTMVADLAVGQLFVAPENNKVLPTIYAELADGSTIINFTPLVYTPVGNYATDDSLVLTTDAVNGRINLPANVSGKYRVSISLVANFDIIGNTNELMTLGIHDGTGFIKEITTDIIRNGTSWSYSASIFATLSELTSYQLQVNSSTALSNVSWPIAEFNTESVHLT